jgi:hypothetical protein
MAGHVSQSASVNAWKLVARAQPILASNLHPSHMQPYSAHTFVPQELWIYVLDYLNDEFRTLRACALVSTFWRLTCQKHLFRVVTVRTRELWTRLIKPQSDHSRLLPLIHRLRIGCLLRKDDLLDITALFPNVSAISCCGASVDFDMMHKFPKLYELKVARREDVRGWVDIRYPLICRPLDLREVTFRTGSSTMTGLLRWMNFIASETLVTARISLDVGGRMLDEFPDFIRGHTSLRTLEIHMHPVGWYPGAVCLLFTWNPFLILASILDIAHHITSMSIETLVIRGSAHNEVMTYIADLLHRFDFVNLRQLDIYLGGKIKLAWRQQRGLTLAMHCPRRNGTGKLIVSTDSSESHSPADVCSEKLARSLDVVRLYVTDMDWEISWDRIMSLFGNAHDRGVVQVLPIGSSRQVSDSRR